MRELKFIHSGKEKAAVPPNVNNPCCPSGPSRMMPLQFMEKDRETVLSEPYETVPHWVSGTLKTLAGKVYRVLTDWSWPDYRGQIRSRTSAYRMKYAVNPGLYATGKPDRDSDIFVTANYKLSFDILRRELKGLNAWILVLNTKSINVWCAAGKGTFGTEELIKRISKSRLDTLVNHRRIILPQLSGPGVNAKTVKQRTGFRVYFGPVRAKDIAAYLKANYRKTEEMSRIGFSFMDRLVLTPMELNPSLKMFPLYALIVLLVFGLQPTGILFKDALVGGLPFLALGLISIFSGAFVTPIMLPVVPFRSFALKGLVVGILAVFASTQLFEIPTEKTGILLIVSFLFFPLATSYIALQFTGSTTYTGMSGVKKELKVAIPLYIAGTVLSLILLIIYKLFTWEIL